MPSSPLLKPAPRLCCSVSFVRAASVMGLGNGEWNMATPLSKTMGMGMDPRLCRRRKGVAATCHRGHAIDFFHTPHIFAFASERGLAYSERVQCLKPRVTVSAIACALLSQADTAALRRSGRLLSSGVLIPARSVESDASFPAYSPLTRKWKTCRRCPRCLFRHRARALHLVAASRHFPMARLVLSLEDWRGQQSFIVLRSCEGCFGACGIAGAQRRARRLCVLYLCLRSVRRLPCRRVSSPSL